MLLARVLGPNRYLQWCATRIVYVIDFKYDSGTAHARWPRYDSADTKHRTTHLKKNRKDDQLISAHGDRYFIDTSLYWASIQHHLLILLPIIIPMPWKKRLSTLAYSKREYYVLGSILRAQANLHGRGMRPAKISWRDGIWCPMISRHVMRLLVTGSEARHR